MTAEAAEILALEALGWLAGDADALGRFLDLAGTDADGLRSSAASPETGVAILDFLLANEDFLMRFCEAAGADPKTVHLARYRLGGEF